MKLMKRKGCDNTIRQLRNDENTKVLAIVGTVEDLLKVGLLEYCDYSSDLWLAISNTQGVKNHFGKTRDEALELFAEKFGGEA